MFYLQRPCLVRTLYLTRKQNTLISLLYLCFCSKQFVYMHIHYYTTAFTVKPLLWIQIQIAVKFVSLFFLQLLEKFRFNMLM